MKSLTGKMLVLIVLTIAVCTAAFTGLSYFELQRSVTSQMKRDGATLAMTLKREIVTYGVSEAEELSGIFRSIRSASEGNIVYISLSDAHARILASSDDEAATLDGVSAASAEGDVSAVVTEQRTLGEMITTPDGRKVYNVSTDIAHAGNGTGSLNIGISLDDMHAHLRRSLMETVTASLLVMAAAIFAGVIASRRLIAPISTMSERVGQFADGNFSVGFPFRSKDEIGAMSVSLDAMRLSLRGMIDSIRRHADYVSNSSRALRSMIKDTTRSADEIGQATEALADGANELVSHAQTGAAGTALLAAALEQLSDKARHLVGATESARDANRDGVRSFHSLRTAIEEQSNASMSMRLRVEQLQGKSAAILDITTVIRGIAEQTNLLALNAMIESIRFRRSLAIGCRRTRTVDRSVPMVTSARHFFICTVSLYTILVG
ncbi:methyl-accepting chemotaxis protein [Paenibacillus sp. TRM 82003]|nr:methyl-accepting chemotaxis protein [Paenibacillus sp. TRM 82003]